MTKADVIADIASKTGIEKKDVSETLENFFEVVKENLSKNNKIIKSQIEQHYKKLTEYHIENKIEMPQLFIDLFAKHLVDGNSLKT